MNESIIFKKNISSMDVNLIFRLKESMGDKNLDFYQIVKQWFLDYYGNREIDGADIRFFLKKLKMLYFNFCYDFEQYPYYEEEFNRHNKVFGIYKFVEEKYTLETETVKQIIFWCSRLVFTQLDLKFSEIFEVGDIVNYNDNVYTIVYQRNRELILISDNPKLEWKHIHDFNLALDNWDVVKEYIDKKQKK